MTEYRWIDGAGEWHRYEGRKIDLEFLRLASGGPPAPQGER